MDRVQNFEEVSGQCGPSGLPLPPSLCVLFACTITEYHFVLCTHMPQVQGLVYQHRSQVMELQAECECQTEELLLPNL